MVGRGVVRQEERDDGVLFRDLPFILSVYHMGQLQKGRTSLCRHHFAFAAVSGGGANDSGDILGDKGGDGGGLDEGDGDGQCKFSGDPRCHFGPR